MGLALEFTASLCGGWLTDDSNRLVRRWALEPRATAPAARAASRMAARALVALEQRWFDHMARVRTAAVEAS